MAGAPSGADRLVSMGRSAPASGSPRPGATSFLPAPRLTPSPPRLDWGHKSIARLRPIRPTGGHTACPGALGDRVRLETATPPVFAKETYCAGPFGRRLLAMRRRRPVVWAASPYGWSCRAAPPGDGPSRSGGSTMRPRFPVLILVLSLFLMAGMSGCGGTPTAQLPTAEPTLPPRRLRVPSN